MVSQSMVAVTEKSAIKTDKELVNNEDQATPGRDQDPNRKVTQKDADIAA